MRATPLHTFQQIVAAVGLNLSVSARQALPLSLPPCADPMARSLPLSLSQVLLNASAANLVAFMQQPSLQQLNALRSI
jgi:hypothetical protein